MSQPASRPTGVHPAAELFPRLNATELGLLASDISARGLLEPIVVYDGLLLDGRNRERACEIAGIEPRYVEWLGEGGSPVAFILSRNLHRRHLDESQRAVIAARAKGMFEEEAAELQRARQFGSRRPPPADGVRNAEIPRESAVCVNLHTPKRGVNARAAKVLNVSTSSVAHASRVLKEGDELLVEAIEFGQVTVSDALAVLALPKAEQRAAVEAVRSGKVRTVRGAAKKAREAQAAQINGVPGLPHFDDGEQHSPKRLRRVARKFSEQCDTLLRYLDLATGACGGPNDHTRRMRDGIEAVRRTMHDLGPSGKSEPVSSVEAEPPGPVGETWAGSEPARHAVE